MPQLRQNHGSLRAESAKKENTQCSGGRGDKTPPILRMGPNAGLSISRDAGKKEGNLGNSLSSLLVLRFF